MERGFKKVACSVMGITQRSYSNYSEQDRPIISLLEKYFTKQDLEEFLKTRHINRMDMLKSIETKLEKDSYYLINAISDFFIISNKIKSIFFLSQILMTYNCKITNLIDLYIKYWKDYLSYEDFQEIIDFIEDSQFLIKYQDVINYLYLKNDFYSLIRFSVFTIKKDFNTSLLINVFINCKNILSLKDSIINATEIYNKFKLTDKDYKLSDDTLISKYFNLDLELNIEYSKLL